MRLMAILALLACAAAPRAGAQTPSYDESLRAFATLELAGRTPAVQPDTPALPDDLLAQRRRARRSPGTVFLIVGGAVAVAGILANEDILIIGGVVVAGYGLYLNVR